MSVSRFPLRFASLAQAISRDELNLRYDSTAAHLDGVHQRDNYMKKFGRGILPLRIEQPSGGAAVVSPPAISATAFTGKAANSPMA